MLVIFVIGDSLWKSFGCENPLTIADTKANSDMAHWSENPRGSDGYGLIGTLDTHGLIECLPHTEFDPGGHPWGGVQKNSKEVPFFDEI